MPTSAAGNSLRASDSPAGLGTGAARRRAEAGFTLIELMVVVAIMAVASTVVIMSMPDPRGSLLSEAERLAARAAAARDNAIVEGKATALVVDPAGYGFSQRQDGAWMPITRKPLGRRLWGEGVVATVATAGQERVVFDNTGLADPTTVTLARDGQRVDVAIAGDGTIDVR
jgi:general secretion pathway protein H